LQLVLLIVAAIVAASPSIGLLLLLQEVKV
jgi:hypothetical protein